MHDPLREHIRASIEEGWTRTRTPRYLVLLCVHRPRTPRPINLGHEAIAWFLMLLMAVCIVCTLIFLSLSYLYPSVIWHLLLAG